MENTYYNNENNSNIDPKKIKVMKATARGQLIGNYGPLIGATLFVIILSGIASGIITPVSMTTGFSIRTMIFYVASFIIALLTQFFYIGIYHMHLNAARGKEIQFSQLAFPVKNGSNRFLVVSFVLTIISYITIIPGQILTNKTNAMMYSSADTAMGAAVSVVALSIVTIILAIVVLILTLGFSLAPFLLIDNPEMNAMEALSSSWKYMKGNKWRLFLLELSFIGLCILGILTFCIAFLWITPYMQQALVVFYETIVQPEQSAPDLGEPTPVNDQEYRRPDPNDYY